MANFLEVLNAVTAGLGGLAAVLNQGAKERQQQALEEAKLLAATKDYTFTPATGMSTEQPGGILGAILGTPRTTSGGYGVVNILGKPWTLQKAAGMSPEIMARLLGASSQPERTATAPAPVLSYDAQALPASQLLPSQGAPAAPSQVRMTPSTPTPLRQDIAARVSAYDRLPPGLKQQVDANVQKYAAQYQVDLPTAYAVIARESNFDPSALGPPIPGRTDRAQGIMQVMPGTGREMLGKGYNPWDIPQNIEAGLKYLGQQLGQNVPIPKAVGDLYAQLRSEEEPEVVIPMARAVTAYNAGPASTQTQTGELSPGVRGYVQDVMALRQHFATRLREAPAPAQASGAQSAAIGQMVAGPATPGQALPSGVSGGATSAGTTMPVSPPAYVDAQFNTRLTPEEETRFQQWKAQYAPRDSGADYDLRGAFTAGIAPDGQTGHWPDTFKKPNHPTFSNQSIYARYGQPGHWEGETFVPSQSEVTQPATTPAPQQTAQPPAAAPTAPAVAATQASVTTNAYGDRLVRGPHGMVLESLHKDTLQYNAMLMAQFGRNREDQLKIVDLGNKRAEMAAQRTKDYLQQKTEAIKASPAAYHEYLRRAQGPEDLQARLVEVPGKAKVTQLALASINAAAARGDMDAVGDIATQAKTDGADEKAIDQYLKHVGYETRLKARETGTIERLQQEMHAQYGSGGTEGMKDALYVVAQEKKKTIPQVVAQHMPEVVAKKMELLERAEKIKLANTPLDATSTQQVNNILYSHKALTVVASSYSQDEIKQFVGLVSGTASKYGSIITDLKRQIFGAGDQVPSDALRAQYMQTVDKAINEAGQTLQKTDPPAAERYFQFAADAKRIEELAFFRGGQQLTGNEIAIVFGMLPTLQDAASGNFIAKLASSQAHTKAQIAQMQKTLGMGRGNAGQVLRDLAQDITTTGEALAKERKQGRMPSGATWSPQSNTPRGTQSPSVIQGGTAGGPSSPAPPVPNVNTFLNTFGTQTPAR